MTRSGKVLWGIARERILKHVRKNDLGFNMMEALRRERLRRAKEAQEKSILLEQ